MLQNKRKLAGNSIYLVLGLIINVYVVACSPLALPQEQMLNVTPAVDVTEPLQSGYPGPTSEAKTPIPPFPTDESPIITPSPDEKVFVGEITEIEAPRKEFGYILRQEQAFTPAGDIVFNKLFIQFEGKEIRLGDDDGSSDLETSNERYIIWKYQPFYDDTKLPLKAGLYAYSTESGEQTLIVTGWAVGLSVIDGEWVLYTSWENQPTGANFPENDTPGEVRPLFAFNLVSKKTLTVTQSIPVISGRDRRSFFGVSGDQVGWVEYDMKSQAYSMKFSNLNTGDVKTLDVELKQPRFFSLSRDLVVWRDTWWHGYSLSQKEFFTIPYAPKGWENIAGFIVTAKDGSLEWQISNTPNNVTHYFTAPVIIK